MITLEYYIEYYNLHNKLINEGYSARKNRLNERQLCTKYHNYIKNIERQEAKKAKAFLKTNDNVFKVDEKWVELKRQLDLTECTLINLLKVEKRFDLLQQLRKNAKHLINIIDPAHVFPKGGFPYLKYDIINVVPLNRFSHSCIDQGRDPISGELITKEMTKLYWKMLIGNENFNKLIKKIREH